MEYDRTNEGNYANRVYTLDCTAEELPFVSQLPNATSFGNQDEVVQVVIHPTGSLAQVGAEEHFDSLDKLIAHFGSIHFKKSKQ